MPVTQLAPPELQYKYGVQQPVQISQQTVSAAIADYKSKQQGIEVPKTTTEVQVDDSKIPSWAKLEKGYYAVPTKDEDGLWQLGSITVTKNPDVSVYEQLPKEWDNLWAGYIDREKQQWSSADLSGTLYTPFGFERARAFGVPEEIITRLASPEGRTAAIEENIRRYNTSKFSGTGEQTQDKLKQLASLDSLKSTDSEQRIRITNLDATVTPDIQSQYPGIEVGSKIVRLESGQQAVVGREANIGDTVAKSDADISSKSLAEAKEFSSPTVIGASPTTNEVLIEGVTGQQKWIRQSPETVERSNTIISLKDSGLINQEGIIDVKGAIRSGFTTTQLSSIGATKSSIDQAKILVKLEDSGAINPDKTVNVNKAIGIVGTTELLSIASDESAMQEAIQKVTPKVPDDMTTSSRATDAQLAALGLVSPRTLTMTAYVPPKNKGFGGMFEGFFKRSEEAQVASSLPAAQAILAAQKAGQPISTKLMTPEVLQASREADIPIIQEQVQRAGTPIMMASSLLTGGGALAVGGAGLAASELPLLQQTGKGRIESLKYQAPGFIPFLAMGIGSKAASYRISEPEAKKIQPELIRQPTTRELTPAETAQIKSTLEQVSEFQKAQALPQSELSRISQSQVAEIAASKYEEPSIQKLGQLSWSGNLFESRPAIVIAAPAIAIPSMIAVPITAATITPVTTPKIAAPAYQVPFIVPRISSPTTSSMIQDNINRINELANSGEITESQRSGMQQSISQLQSLKLSPEQVRNEINRIVTTSVNKEQADNILKDIPISGTEKSVTTTSSAGLESVIQQPISVEAEQMQQVQEQQNQQMQQIREQLTESVRMAEVRKPISDVRRITDTVAFPFIPMNLRSGEQPAFGGGGGAMFEQKKKYIIGKRKIPKLQVYLPEPEEPLAIYGIEENVKVKEKPAIGKRQAYTVVKESKIKSGATELKPSNVPLSKSYRGRRVPITISGV